MLLALPNGPSSTVTPSLLRIAKELQKDLAKRHTMGVELELEFLQESIEGRTALGLPVPCPYWLSDLADDTAALTRLARLREELHALRRQLEADD